MEATLIVLEKDNIIVSDEKLEIGNIVAETLINGRICLFTIHTLNDIDKKTQKKLIASDNPIKCEQCIRHQGTNNIYTCNCNVNPFPTINYNGLEEQFGIFDVEKLYPTNKGGLMSMPTRHQINNSLRQEGFKKAQKLNDKKFSLEDIKNAMKYIIDKNTFYGDTLDDAINMQKEIIENYLEILQQPKQYQVEVEIGEKEVKIINMLI